MGTIIISLSLLICFTKSNLVSERQNVLAEFLKYVYEEYTYLDHGYVGIVINDKKTFTVDKSLQYIHQSEMNAIFLMNFNDMQNAQKQLQRVKTKKYYFGDLKMMIIFLELRNNNVTIVLENLQSMPVYRRRSRILLIFDDYINIESLKKIFRVLWSKQFLNVVIAYNLQDKFLQVYTYNPFLKENESLQNYTDIRFTKNIFYDKLKNLYKYKLTCMILRDDDVTKIKPLPKNRTGKIIYDGYDPEIVRNLVNYMNGSVEFINLVDLLKPGERNPWRYTNDLEKNALEMKRKLISENRIDMLNSDEMVLNDDFSEVTESLYPHDKDDLVIVLRRGQKIPYYKYLFLIFNILTWFILIFNLFLAIAFSALVIHVLKISWFINYFNLFRPVICTSVPKLTTVNSERIFFIFWFLYCFIIAMAFQSILTSILMEPKFYPDITTLEKLHDSGIKLTVYRTMYTDLEKTLKGTSKYGLVNKMIDIPDKFDNANYSYINFTIELFDHPIVIPYHRAVIATKLIRFCKNEKELLNIIPESPMPRYMAFQIAAGSPYLNALDETLTRFIESGHLKHWRKQWEHYYVLTHVIIPPSYSNKKKNSEFTKMTMPHLYSAFIILFVGQLICLFVFIIEICTKLLYKRK